MWAWLIATERNLVGSILVISASIVSNVAANVQKRSHNIEQLRPEEEQRPYVRRKLWWLGMAGVVVGGIMDFLALGFASQTLVASLGGAASLITNAVVSHTWNRESAGISDCIGSLSIIAGSIVFAFTAQESRSYTLMELEDLFIQPVFVVLEFLQFVLIIMMLERVESSRVRAYCRSIWMCRNNPRAELIPSVEISIESDVDSEGEDTTNDKINNSSNVGGDGMDQYIYAGCSGLAGAQSVLFGGCASKVLIQLWESGLRRRTVNLLRPTPLIFITGMILAVIVQTHLLNRAMQQGKNLETIPIFNAFWTFFSVQVGVVFYQTGSVNLAGVTLMSMGVACLAQQRRGRGRGNRA